MCQLIKEIQKLTRNNRFLPSFIRHLVLYILLVSAYMHGYQETQSSRGWSCCAPHSVLHYNDTTVLSYVPVLSSDCLSSFCLSSDCLSSDCSSSDCSSSDCLSSDCYLEALHRFTKSMGRKKGSKQTAPI